MRPLAGRAIARCQFRGAQEKWKAAWDGWVAATDVVMARTIQRHRQRAPTYTTVYSVTWRSVAMGRIWPTSTRAQILGDAGFYAGRRSLVLLFSARDRAWLFLRPRPRTSEGACVSGDNSVYRVGDCPGPRHDHDRGRGGPLHRRGRHLQAVQRGVVHGPELRARRAPGRRGDRRSVWRVGLLRLLEDEPVQRRRRLHHREPCGLPGAPVATTAVCSSGHPTFSVSVRAGTTPRPAAVAYSNVTFAAMVRAGQFANLELAPRRPPPREGPLRARRGALPTARGHGRRRGPRAKS
jgi:hypothetical protein